VTPTRYQPVITARVSIQLPYECGEEHDPCSHPCGSHILTRLRQGELPSRCQLIIEEILNVGTEPVDFDAVGDGS
jgi:hypothetical protein